MSRDIESVIKQIESAPTISNWVLRRNIVGLIAMVLEQHQKGQGTGLLQAEIDRIVSIVEKLADDPKWEIRVDIIRPLIVLGDDRAKKIVTKLKDDNNRWVKELATATLLKFPKRELTQPHERVDEISNAIINLINKYQALPKNKLYEAIEQIKEMAYKEIAGDIAHQLNNRLTSFNQNLSKLLEEISKSRTIEKTLRPLINMIKESSSAFSTLVGSLVRYSKRVDEPFQPVNLYDSLSEAFSRAKSRCIGNKKLTLAEVFEVDKLIRIDGHSDGLYEAFFNIICNALESVSDNGEIAIRALLIPDKQSVKITISDTGYGMTEGQIEDSKKRYFSTKSGGIGLGLPIAIKIIEAEHKGKLDIASQSKQGTTVTIELPQKQS